jgi:steroid 5-alpha reductase family enzyme
MSDLSPTEQLTAGAALVVVVMSVLWIVERVRADATHVDVAWSLLIGALALLYAVSSPTAPLRRILFATLALVWSIRLGGYLLVTRVLGRNAEDGRYQDLRRSWGRRAHTYFFVLFQAQALLAWIFSLPILAALRNPQPLRAWEGLALAVWLVALAGETLADRQLARFRSRPEARERACREGLWRYSRHPNYFFEWLGWWAYVAASAGSDWLWVSLIGPGVLLFLLFKVTGIPATEAQALRSRGEDYRRYQQSTSVFVPWFPRRET